MNNQIVWRKKVFQWLFIGLLSIAGWTMECHAQFTYGTTGLLHAPSAEMQQDKTFSKLLSLREVVSIG